MARPNNYEYDLCVEICSEVANGFNIKTVLSSKAEYPTFQTWCNWKRQHNELFDLYMRSIQDKAESVDEEIDNIMSEMRHGGMEHTVGRVLIDTLKWKAAKYYPKMFGDKIDVTSGNDPIQNTTINLSGLSNKLLEELESAASNQKEE